VKFLLDVNVLLAGIWTSHPHHSETFDWLDGKSVVLCPLASLGFLRISSNKKAFNFAMDKARAGLTSFCAERKAEWIWDDLPPLDSKPDKSDAVTDFYLADLAAKHGLKLATFDTGIAHSAAELVSALQRSASSGP
jgi:predicted nucleic acid-binding protein